MRTRTSMLLLSSLWTAMWIGAVPDATASHPTICPHGRDQVDGEAAVCEDDACAVVPMTPR